MRKPDKEKEDFIHEIGKLEQSRVVGARWSIYVKPFTK
jgi:hypothetical protein